MPEKTWDTCEWFSSLNPDKCPACKEELMIEHRRNVSFGVGYESKYDPHLGPEINKLFCQNCKSYRAKK